MTALDCGQLTLVTFDTDETVSVDGRTVRIIPAADWLCRDSGR